MGAPPSDDRSDGSGRTDGANPTGDHGRAAASVERTAESGSIRSAAFERRDEGPSARRVMPPPPTDAASTEGEEAAEGAFSRDSEGSSLTVAEERIGQMLSGWRLDGIVGHGRTASVYVASNPDGERAAVKIMHRRFRGNVRIRRRLFREAQVARALASCAGVTNVLASDVARGGEPYVVMERLYGRDLDRLRDAFDGEVPLRFALTVALGAIEILEEAHAAGVVHRNLSPFNIYVTVDGEVRLFDFGSALVAGEAPMTLDELASDRHGYLAPELLAGEHGAASADVFGLAAVLFSLLGGQRIGDPDAEESEEPEGAFIPWSALPETIGALRPDLGTGLTAAIDGAMQRAAAQRTIDLSQLRAAIVAALQEESPSLAHEASARRAFLEETLGRFVDAQGEMADELSGAWRSTTLLREMFRLVENVLFSARRHGWEHGETEIRLEHLVRIILDAVADDPDGIYWLVRPYSMDFLGEDVWQPEPPFDELCYNLFDSGFRKMHLLPGLNDEECRRFLRWLVLDPKKDLPAEDDLATVFWSLEFEHIRCELLSAVVLQDVEDYEKLDEELKTMQTDAIEQLRASVQAKLRGEGERFDDAAEVARAAELQAVGRVTAVALPQVLRSAFGEAVEGAIPLWRGRLAHILLHALRDAEAVGDQASVVGAWSKFVSQALKDRDIDDALAIFGEIADASPDRATLTAFAGPFMDGGAMWQTLSLLVPIQGARPTGPNSAFFARRLLQLFRVVPSDRTPLVVDAAARCSDRALLSALLKFIERHLVGHEKKVAEALRDATPLLGTHLIRILAKTPSRDGIRALMAAGDNPSPIVRITAAEVLTRYAPKRAVRELRDLMHHEETTIRKRAVECVRVNRLLELADLLITRMGERSFHHLPADERRHILLTIYEVAEERGEHCVTELVAGHGLMRDADLDVTRLIAVGLLEQIALSDAALEAVESASKKRWWNSGELQKTAARAAETIRARIQDLDRELEETRGRTD